MRKLLTSLEIYELDEELYINVIFYFGFVTGFFPHCQYFSYLEKNILNKTLFSIANIGLLFSSTLALSKG